MPEMFPSRGKEMNTVHFKTLDITLNITGCRILYFYDDLGFVESIEKTERKLFAGPLLSVASLFNVKISGPDNAMPGDNRAYSTVGRHLSCYLGLIWKDRSIIGVRRSYIYYLRLSSPAENIWNRAHEEAHAMCCMCGDESREYLTALLSRSIPCFNPAAVKGDDEKLADWCGFYATAVMRDMTPIRDNLDEIFEGEKGKK